MEHLKRSVRRAVVDCNDLPVNASFLRQNASNAISDKGLGVVALNDETYQWRTTAHQVPTIADNVGRSETLNVGDVRGNCRNPAAFVIEYRDGLRATALPDLEASDLRSPPNLQSYGLQAAICAPMLEEGQL